MAYIVMMLSLGNVSFKLCLIRIDTDWKDKDNAIATACYHVKYFLFIFTYDLFCEQIFGFGWMITNGIQSLLVLPTNYSENAFHDRLCAVYIFCTL